MKKVLILVAIVLICASSMVNAQDLKGMFNISPFGGIGIPMGKMSDCEGEDALCRTMGFKFGADAEYFFTPNMGVGVEFLYAMFGNDYTDAELQEFGDDKMHTMNIGAYAKYVLMPENMLRPYAKAGAGITMNKLKDAIVDYDESENPILGDIKLSSKLYITGGVGAMYWVSEMISIFAEADFDYLMTKNATIKVNDEDTGMEVNSNYFFLDFKAGINVWFGGTE